MSMVVDGRILRGLHHVLRRDERRFRPVIQNARRRKLGSHAASRPDLGRTGRTRFAWLDRRTAPAATATASVCLLGEYWMRENERGAQTGEDEHTAHESS